MGTSRTAPTVAAVRRPGSSCAACSYPAAVLAWIDLETTGLDPLVHSIVEIAVLVTDDGLATVTAGPDLVIHQPDEALARMDDTVVKMHTASGLLDKIRSSTVTLEEAGAEVLGFLRSHIAEPRTVPLCGNSIGTDRRFLARHLPEIEDFLHYRSIDVSTVKELARRWQPEVFEGAPAKAEGHRALDDIIESLEELRWYRRAGFIGGRSIATDAADPGAATGGGVAGA